MEVKSLSNQELLVSVKKVVSEERRITKEVIEHFAEVERRMLYLELGFSSMFSYATKELGYSEDEAYRRVSAARLLREIPEIAPQIELGELLVSSLCQAQKVFRKQKPTLEEKKELLGSLVGKSKREAERILDKIDSNPRRMHSIEVDDETLELLKRIRDLEAHKVKDGYNDLLKRIATEHLKRIDPSQKPTGTLKTPCPDKVTRYIPQAVKRLVWRRDQGRCTYTHKGTRCESTYGIQIHHIIDFAMGGAHETENLRLLCAAHNKFMAVKTFGKEKMAKFVHLT